jgi:hypothetical protein
MPSTQRLLVLTAGCAKEDTASNLFCLYPPVLRHSKLGVYEAVLANGAITVAKFIVGAPSGGSAVIAEALPGLKICM